MASKISKSIQLYSFWFAILIWVGACGDGPGNRKLVVEPPVNVEFSYQAKGQLVSFSATPSPLTNGVTLEWDLGDGHRETGSQVVHYYTEPGIYTVRVTLTDVQLRQTFQEQSLAIEALPGCDYEWIPANPSFPRYSRSAASPLGHVMVGSRGRLLFSENGFEWCEIATMRGEGFQDVFWDGSRFVALSDERFSNGSSVEVYWYSRLATSPDGKNWSWQAGPSTQVYVLAGNGIQLFAIGGQDINPLGETFTVHQLTDAGKWIPVFETSDHELTDLVWTGARFLLFGRSRMQTERGMPDILWSSIDGSEWNLQNNAEIKGSKMATSGDVLVRISNGIDRSPDGISWTPVEIDLPEPMMNISWGSNRFVALGRSYAMTSQDGLQWSTAALPIELNPGRYELNWDGWIWLVTGMNGPVLWSSQGLDWRTIGIVEPTIAHRNWTQAIATEKGFAIGGNSLAEGGVHAGSFIRETRDGLLWEETGVHPDIALYALVQTPSGLLVGGANVNAPDFAGRLLLRADNGWQLQLNTRWAISHLAQLGDISLAFDDEGQSFRSEDAVSWYQATKLPSLTRLKVVEGWFWAITQDGALLRSPNGEDWEAMALPDPLRKLSDITRKGDLWMLLSSEDPASQSYFATSENLRDWTFASAGFSTRYSRLATDGAVFYAAGSFISPQASTLYRLPHAALVTSEDGISWRPMILPFFEPGDMAFGNLGGLLINGDQVFTKLKP